MICPGCGGKKQRTGAFVCLGCWSLLPRQLRAALFANRYKPTALARAFASVREYIGACARRPLRGWESAAENEPRKMPLSRLRCPAAQSGVSRHQLSLFRGSERVPDASPGESETGQDAA